MRNGQGSKQKIQWGAVAGQLYKVTSTPTHKAHIHNTHRESYTPIIYIGWAVSLMVAV
jgi:hypothetical protein